MAERKHEGYRCSESREQKSSYATPRQELASSKHTDGLARNGSRLHNGDRIVRDGVRHKEIQERDSLNDDDSSSTGSDSGTSGGGNSRRRGYSVRIVDREPGELSSESGSDCAVESNSLMKDDVAPNFENGQHSSPSTKKRKFSPDKCGQQAQAKGLPNGKMVSTTSCSMPPSLAKTDHSSPDAVLCSKDSRPISPVNSNQEISLSRGSEEPQPLDYSLSEASESVRDLYSYGQRRGIDEEADRVEEEDYATTRNISSSRWAGDANSPADEGEILYDDDMYKGRKFSAARQSDARLSQRSSSPELAEIRIGSSVGAQERSSGVEGATYSRPSSGDHGSESDLDGIDVMEVDNEHNNSGMSPGNSETDSGDNVHSHEALEPSVPPQRTVNMTQGCRRVDEFERLNKIDEGTYGVVYRARDNKTGEVVALKKVKMEKEREGFPLTSLREINILLSFHHPAIVDVKEVVVGSNLDSIFMVMEYMEHDLKALMETMKQPFSQSEVKCLMLQLLEGIKYLHDNWVLHRDLKTSNLLLNNQGELKICDFGLARQYGSPLKPYTHLVVTLWYRAPELLLGAKQYSTAIDMWSLGCIMAELSSKEPLFNGKREFDQLDKIFRVLGTPDEAIWPGFSKLPGVKVNFVKHQCNLLRKKFPATSFTGSPVLSDAGFDLLSRLLTYDPEKRITAEEALRHEWFHEVPLPKSKEFMPTFPARNAQDRRTRRVLKSPDPLEEQRKREQHQAQFGTGGLFG